MPNGEQYFIEFEHSERDSSQRYLRYDSQRRFLLEYQPGWPHCNDEEEVAFFGGGWNEEREWIGCANYMSMTRVDSVSPPFIRQDFINYYNEYTLDLGSTFEWLHIQHFGGMYFTWDLVYAEIGGQSWGDYVAVHDVGISSPDTYTLDHPYPNPFNGQVIIPYQIPENSTGSILLILNLLGQEVQRIELDPKRRKVVWNTMDEHGHELATGIYLVQLQLPDGAAAMSKSWSISARWTL